MCQATYFELCKQQTSNTPKEEEDDEEKNTHACITEFGCGTLHILLIVIYTVYTLNVSACHYAFNNKDSSFSVH